MVRKSCCSYAGMNRGPWTAEEDFRLTNYIQIHGVGNWRTLPMKAGLLRCGKGCRLRWMNYLRPNVKRGDISPDEEDMIIRLHKLVGNRWSLIAGRIPGRTDNEIKNYWNTHLRKRFSPSKLEPAYTQKSFEDDNSSELSRIYGIASTFLGTSKAYNGYASQEALGHIESFNHKINGSDNLTAINDFSNVLNTVDNVQWAYENHQSSSMAMPCNFGLPFSSITVNESITDTFLTDRINHDENLSWSESKMLLQGPMLTSEYTTQFPSCRDEINGALAVDYQNMVEAINGNGMVVGSNIVKSQLLESLSCLSDWYYPPNGSSFSLKTTAYRFMIP